MINQIRGKLTGIVEYRTLFQKKKKKELKSLSFSLKSVVNLLSLQWWYT